MNVKCVCSKIESIYLYRFIEKLSNDKSTTSSMNFIHKFSTADELP